MDNNVAKTAFFGAAALDTFKIYKKAYKAYQNTTVQSPKSTYCNKGHKDAESI